MPLRPATLALSLLASLAASGASGGAPPPPVLSFAQANEWTLHFEVEARSARSQYYLDANGRVAPTLTPMFRLDSAEVFFPALESSATHTSDVSNFNFKAEVRWENVVVDQAPTLTPGPLNVGRYLRLLLPAGKAAYVGDQLRLIVDIPSVCRETRFDDARAFAIKWPAKPWPGELEPCLHAERFIESDAKEVRDLVDQWTGGRTRSAPPARLAKFLCGKVVEFIQPTGNGIATNSHGQMQGFAVEGAAYATHSPRPSAMNPATPSEYDMTCLLVAVYRAAGIPARLVIAIDPIKSDASHIPVFRSWVEFALLDESVPAPPNWPTTSEWPGRLEWIPVDVARQREFSSRPPPLEQRWQYFGHNEDTDDLIPVSFQFHPPALSLPPPPPPQPTDKRSPSTTIRPGNHGAVVAYGSVGLWGWRPQPGIPPIDQALRAWGQHTSHRGDEKQPTRP